jgi:hypothetical protein
MQSKRGGQDNSHLWAGLDRSRTGVLVVHALNPWGFRHLRRVSEHNVDLNRNFDVSEKLFETANEGYRKLSSFLNPDGAVGARLIDLSYLEMLRLSLVHGRAMLQQAILGGQYEVPEGLYFGGRAFEPQKGALERLLLEIAEPYRAVFVMDLHTGYGERGKLHLFGTPGVGTPWAMEAVFRGLPVDTAASDETFYENSGDFVVFAGRRLGDKVFVGMTLEYGTLDSQTTLGAMRSLQNMRVENQGFHFGYDSERARRKAQTRFLEMYNPTDRGYREGILAQTVETVPLLAARFAVLAL